MIEELATEHGVAEACDLLAVSASGFYAWRRREPGPRAQADRQIGERIRVIHATSRKTYGYPRVTRALRKEGIRCGRKRVAGANPAGRRGPAYKAWKLQNIGNRSKNFKKWFYAEGGERAGFGRGGDLTRGRGWKRSRRGRKRDGEPQMDSKR